MSEPVLHRGIGAPSACRSCKKPITWAVMPSSGKKMPFEVDAAGRWHIENGVAKYVGEPTAESAQLELGAKPVTPPPRYTSHFSTCPQAKEWRNRGE